MTDDPRPLSAPPPPPPPPSSSVAVDVPAPATDRNPPPAKKKPSIGTPVIVLLALVAVVGAYFAVTRSMDRPAPSEADVAAAFVPIPGLTYSELPRETSGALESAFTSQSGPEQVAHFEARQLAASNGPAAVVFILAIDPDEMQGNFEAEYVAGFTVTSQATVEDLQIGNTMGHIASTPLGTVAFFFDEDGFAFNIVGTDIATVESIARTLQAGNA